MSLRFAGWRHYYDVVTGGSDGISVCGTPFITLGTNLLYVL
jgi:hypothetical protein